MFLLVLVFSALASTAFAHCTDATLHGSYGLHATGVNGAGANFAAVGRFNFDGKGNLIGKLFVRVNGNNVPEFNVPLDITGTYSVDSHCVVTDTWNIGNSSSTHTSIIVHSGDGYFILNTTQNDGVSVISGEAQRQHFEFPDLDND
jgi:hypothetical protein